MPAETCRFKKTLVEAEYLLSQYPDELVILCTVPHPWAEKYYNVSSWHSYKHLWNVARQIFKAISFEDALKFCERQEKR